jgi:ketosteroid isomerase-like protein
LTREQVTLDRLRRGELDALLEEFYSPDVVFDLRALEVWPESETYEGHDGIRRFYEAWFGPWEEVTFELESAEAVGDLILSVAVQRGTGVSSRAPVEARFAILTTVRESKFVRARFFWNADDAVRAAEGEGPSG